ncbi:MAG: hypothetical protein IKA25_02485 [Alphaproteobacteria bacterium]|nr:hypothetical protein [Alphaproteobacteria bacterium]
MKKFLIPILAFVPIGANAVSLDPSVGLQGCVSATCPTSSTAIVYEMTHVSGVCSSYTTKCLYNSANGYYLKYQSCTGGCNADYLVLESQNLSDESAYGAVCNLNFTNTTRNICTCGTQCDSCGAGIMPIWSSPKTGYQSLTEFSCGLTTGCECTQSTKYRCAAGYYGTASYSQLNGYRGCTRCPSSGGVYGTSAAGSTEITSCYMPSGKSMTDDVGTYEYTSNCYYTE